MNPGHALATIAETQIGTRGDLPSGRAALYGYLLATDAKLAAFEPAWERTGFGDRQSRGLSLLPKPADPPFRLLQAAATPSEPPVILRMHSWCAAFVDWCVQQLLADPSQTTALSYFQRPKTALAFGLLPWGKSQGCRVFEGPTAALERGDIVVYTFSHTGIVVEPDKGSFYAVEGNTTTAGGGNQGYIVERRLRARGLVKGVVRLPSRHPLGDFEVDPALKRIA